VSQEAVEIVRAVLDAVNRRDRAAWLALHDPQTECVPARDWPESDPIRGREAVWDFYRTAIGAWEEGAFDANAEVIEASNGRVLQHVYGEMQGKASGASVVHTMWSVSGFRNGKVLRVEWFAGRREALRAVGLEE
jgi:ketosteroid isomerase-like protein